MYKILLFFFVCSFALGQVPQGFNYQGVIRDANGDVLANQNVTLAFGIVNDAGSSSPLFSER